MIKKTTLLTLITCITVVFAKAQTPSSNLLSEEKINQRLENSRKKGLTPWEIEHQGQFLNKQLKKQNEAITNGTFNQKTIFTPPQVNNTACSNPGFENGTNSGWNFFNGNSFSPTTINLPCNTCATTTGAINTVVTTTSSVSGQCTNGIDYYGHFPVVASGANGGSYSLLLNDVSLGGKLEKAQYSFVVTAASNNYFTYQYAIVLQDGGHPMNEQAFFSVEMMDVTTHSVIPCSSYEQSVVGVGSGSMTGWSISSSDQSVYYKPWTSTSIDLTPYLGDTIAVNFIVGDCSQSGHFGYAYIDATCGISPSVNQITQSNPLCTGGGITTLQGPYGMSTYNWTGPVTGNSQNLVTGVPGTYTLSGTTATGCAAPDLYYTLTQLTATAPMVSINVSNDTICAASTTTLTANGADTYVWSDYETTSAISVSPTINTAYLVTGTDNATGCINTATQLIVIKQPLVNIGIASSNTGNPCQGVPITLTASGANTYTWSNTATTNSITVAPLVNTNYAVTGKDTTSGCTNTAVIFVTVAPAHIFITTSVDSVCLGHSSTLTAGGATSYTWSTGETTASIIVTPTVTTTYSVSATGGCANGVDTDSVTIKALTSPNVTISATALCATTVTLTASGANTYAWNIGYTTPTITVPTSYSDIYIVTGTATNLCQSTFSIAVNATNNGAPAICMVTTDSSTNYAYNYIIWDKTGYTNVDSFIVYRYDAVSTNYFKIGAVSQTTLSEFKDTSFSIGGPNGGNPLYASWTYKLAVLDSCGNVSPMSPYHQTMFVQQNGANFTWNAYTVESATNTVTGYALLRDDNNTGNWQVLVNTNTLAATDPNFSSYPNGNWRVEALGFNCTPTLRLASNNNSTQNSLMKSSSNTVKPTITGVDKTAANDLNLMLYPNPTNETLNVICKVKNAKLYVTDMLGKKVMQVNTENDITSIDVNQLSNGIYFLNVNISQIVVLKGITPILSI